MSDQAGCRVFAYSRSIAPEMTRAAEAVPQPRWHLAIHSLGGIRPLRKDRANRQAKPRLIGVLLSWRILVMIGIGLHPAAALSSDRAAQGDAAGKMATVDRRTTFSISEAIRQNSLGLSEGSPAGVPRSYNWYKGWSPGGQKAAPAGFTAVTAWGQVYQDSSEPTYTNPNAHVEVANTRTYVHMKSTDEWILVQDQSTHQIAGGHYVPDFVDNSGYPMKITTRSDGTASFDTPPDGYNDHFWPTPRGTFAEGEVDAVYVQMDMRVTDPNLNLIANIGADWWRDDSAPYLHDHSNNPGAGGSNWIDLTTEWRTLAFFSSRTVFNAQPPPPLVRSTVEAPPVLPASPTKRR